MEYREEDEERYRNREIKTERYKTQDEKQRVKKLENRQQYIMLSSVGSMPGPTGQRRRRRPSIDLAPGHDVMSQTQYQL